MTDTAPDTERLEALEHKLMLLNHKNVWSKQDREDREWLQDEIAKEAAALAKARGE